VWLSTKVRRNAFIDVSDEMRNIHDVANLNSLAIAEKHAIETELPVTLLQAETLVSSYLAMLYRLCISYEVKCDDNWEGMSKDTPWPILI
jgi:hypothetical protein